jgi:hypothetical protein
VTNKLLALNVGGGSTTTSIVQSQQQHQLQPYPYKNEDFVIPTIKRHPRYIQRYINAQTQSSMTTKWIAIALTAFSFAKAFYYKWTNSTMESNISLQPTIGIGNDDYSSSSDFNGVLESNDDSDSDLSSVLESASTEEDIGTAPTLIDQQSVNSSTIPPEWKEKYDHLMAEATSLREQLSVIQEMLDKKQSETLQEMVSSPESSDDKGDISTSNNADALSEELTVMATEIQTLKESVQYWKRVAEMNEQQISNIVQVERQNSIHQMEQLKMDMLEMVDTERTSTMKEFTSMIQELRDSLNGQTESNSTIQ